jgi:hypothetical protein
VSQERNRIERETVEAIAKWLDERAPTTAPAGSLLHDVLLQAAAALRSGAWRAK